MINVKNYVVIFVLIVSLLSMTSTVVAQKNVDNITTTTQSGEELIDIETEKVDITIRKDFSMDISVQVNNFSIGFKNISSENGLGKIEGEHSSLDSETVQSAQTGLCAVGGSDVIPFGVKDNGDISSEAESEGFNPETGKNSDVVDECID